jgi:hypothetical protein
VSGDAGFTDCRGVPRDADGAPDIDAMWEALTADHAALAEWLEELLKELATPAIARFSLRGPAWNGRAIELSYRLVAGMRVAHERLAAYDRASELPCPVCGV